MELWRGEGQKRLWGQINLDVRARTRNSLACFPPALSFSEASMLRIPRVFRLEKGASSPFTLAACESAFVIQVFLLLPTTYDRPL